MFDFFREWLEETSGLTVIWLQPNAPRPSDSYITLELLNSEFIGLPYRQKIDENGEMKTFRNFDGNLSVNFYVNKNQNDPNAAFNLLANIKQKLDLKDTELVFYQNRLAIRGIEFLENFTEISKNRFESRATFDLRLGTSVEIHDTLGIIESVGINGEVQGQEVQATLTL